MKHTLSLLKLTRRLLKHTSHFKLFKTYIASFISDTVHIEPVLSTFIKNRAGFVIERSDLEMRVGGVELRAVAGTDGDHLFEVCHITGMAGS
ncbi:MAG: hypothetical protein IPJ82_22395 [Lewinellaceae bacterium]|nr:hypothetical protein [Lewinellaceae bacterium]